MSGPEAVPLSKSARCDWKRPVLGAIRPISSFRPFPFPTLFWMPDRA